MEVGEAFAATICAIMPLTNFTTNALPVVVTHIAMRRPNTATLDANAVNDVSTLAVAPKCPKIKESSKMIKLMGMMMSWLLGDVA